MLNSIAKNAQTVATNQNVLFTETRVKSRRCACNTGWLAHDNGSGLFEITNRGNLPMAVEVEFNGNVTASAIGAVALSIKQNGEPISGTEMDYTVATANVYQNVGATTLIAVRPEVVPLYRLATLAQLTHWLRMRISSLKSSHRKGVSFYD